MKKNLLIIISVSLMVPSVTLASWWNPTSWGIFSFIFHNDSKVQITSTSTQVTTNISTTTINADVSTSTIISATSTYKMAPKIIETIQKNIEPIKVEKIDQTPILTPATSEQVSDLMKLCTVAKIDCTTTIDGYNMNTIFRNNMDVMIKEWKAKQQSLLVSCTPAEKTKVLDDFLFIHPEYQPQNDPGDSKWNFFRTIYHQYNTTNICPQELKVLLEKVNEQFIATYSSANNWSQNTVNSPSNQLQFIQDMSFPTSFQQQNDQQQIQDQIQNIKKSVDQLKLQQEQLKQAEFQKQQLLQMLPNCSQLSFGDNRPCK